MPLQIGQTLLDKYRIERLLGEGGFGFVYEATDLLLRRLVAIKELNPKSVAIQKRSSVSFAKVKPPVR